jgi:hypothetical protein
MAQLVWRHSCGADRLPVVVRFPAGPWVRLKTVGPPKGNGLGQKLPTHTRTQTAKSLSITTFAGARHFPNQYTLCKNRVALQVASCPTYCHRATKL